ncbi:Ff.00g121640.m01.CDS01 [Fusarium sp. VM40]|nr:Ff.00g121640.m01.CDS01 [Fusarium sp. VM40]
MRRTISILMGSLALLATVTVMAVLIVLTNHTPKDSSGRTLSQVSVTLESVTLVTLGWFLSTYASTHFRRWSTRCLGVDFGACLLAILFATVATVATLIQSSKSTLDREDKLVQASKHSLLIGLSVALGLCFVSQTGFLALHFFFTRKSDHIHSMDEERGLPSFRSKTSLKTLRYSQTISDHETTPRKMGYMGYQTPASSIGGRSRSGTVTSIKLQLSNVVRSATTKSASSSDSRRPISVGSDTYRSSDDAFDTWDTSSVDTNNRQVVMEATTPPPRSQGHFLETIPGSPTPSRGSDPGHEMPLEPPRIRRRSRSFSPVSLRREQLHSQALMNDLPEPSLSESHIHPLFRSDSPEPPPMATPGTVVVASPIAGQVITHRQSVRSLRSVSTFVGPSPLGHREEHESILEEQESETASQNSSERPLTPPIPEWVMGAGARASWSDYNSRKSRIDGDGEAKEEQKK